MQRHYILTNAATDRRYGRKTFNTRLAAPEPVTGVMGMTIDGLWLRVGGRDAVVHSGDCSDALRKTMEDHGIRVVTMGPLPVSASERCDYAGCEVPR